MKKLLLILLFPLQIFATNYYVKADGNDALSGLDDANAWGTISKINGFTFAANDHIYLKKGSTWSETLTVPRNNLFFETYGTGDAPKLSGLEQISSWSNLGSNIWESNATSAPDDVDIVLVNGEQKAPGRFPNTGYLTYQSSTGSSYTASSLPSSPSFTGGECVSRKYRWIMDRETITSHSGQILNVSASGQPPLDNMGLFVQKHNNTLDVQGEWCYQAASNKLRMYSTSTPATTKLSFMQMMCNIGSRTNTYIDGIEFEGGSTAGISGSGSNTNTTIKNCTIRNCGVYGINLVNSAGCLVDNNQVIDVLGLAMYLNESSQSTLTVTSNNINRSGWIAGLGVRYGNSPFDDSYSGLICIANGVTAKYNVLDSIGYKGINFNGSNILVERNVVSNFCMTKDDGGAIYTWSQNGAGGYTNRVIRKNITINSIGASAGSTDNTPESHHIYMDGGAMQVIIDSNTCINAPFEDCGIFTNNTSYITIRSNTFYGISNSIRFNRLPDYTDRNRNMIMTRNICYGNDFNFLNWNGNLYNPSPVTVQQDLRDMFTRIDSNFYRSDMPSNSTSAPFYYFAHCNEPACPKAFYGPYNEILSQWQTTIGSENNSVNISTATKDFQYNTTNSPVVYSFAGLSKKDVYGTTYNNSATIQPYSSILFIANGTSGANVPPIANAGLDKTITAPISTTTLVGTGTDTDGSITAYSWSKISGPAGVNFVTSTNSFLSLSNLIPGVYVFQLMVTDNSGATATDQATVTVNGAANVAPTANAGVDQSITLPTSSVTLAGTGTDTDGTITGYAWTKITGGSATITTASSATTGVTGLSAGTYTFRLTVTDNLGLSGTDTMQVFVLSAPNVPPVANAGSNQTITLPTNTVTLTGIGTDADGVIVSYAWVKILGTGSTVASPASSTTAINSLTQGTFQYQLTVTDNLGLTGKDTVQITVNAAANIPPTANAGVNQSITLPTNTLTLVGSGTDVDGTITGYQWAKLPSSPPGSNFTVSTNASLPLTNLVQGVYQFTLTVTDNSGSTGKDTVQVTVNAAPNTQPVANAGPDQYIYLPTSSVVLYGSGTDADPGDAIISYLWLKISGPSGGTITPSNTATTTISALQEGVYQYRLTIEDQNLSIASDDVYITVYAAPNVPPVANAGANQTITLPTNSVTLTGIGTDVDGVISNYAWVKISGSGTVSSPANSTTTITGLTQGVSQFQLTVTDNVGATGKDTVQITVNAAANVPPTANAGANQTITLPTNTTSILGSGTDVDGTITSYQWAKLPSSPAGSNFTVSTNPTLSLTNLVQGVYQFTLTVTDNSGSTGKDTVQVTVNAAPNIPPVSNAGPDQTITLPTNLITMAGSGTDADGTITYQWTKVSGPSCTITIPTIPNTTVINLVAGTYIFSLTVTDNSGASSSDLMTVLVNPVPPVPTPATRIILYNWKF